MTSLIGFLFCLVATISYGLIFVPIKKYDAKDGIFIQFMMGNGIIMVGILVNLILNAPTFYPLATLGGMIWALGNSTAIPILNRIGMGHGILVWGTIGNVVGWCTGRFGLFGLNVEIPSSNRLNILGLIMTLISTQILFHVKSSGGDQSHQLVVASDDRQSLVTSEETNQTSINETVLEASTNENSVDSLLYSTSSSLSISRFFTSIKSFVYRNPDQLSGFAMAIFAGCCFGMTFVPVIYIQTHVPGASKHGLSYVFAYFCGAHITTTFIFIIYNGFYMITRRRFYRPHIVPESAIPAIVSGILWSIGTTSWLIALETLGETITFPIISTTPGIIASLFSVFVYHEITGRRNIIILCCAICASMIGATVTALSKIIVW